MTTMSTKKTAPKKTTAPDELSLLRIRARALETELAKANAQLTDLRAAHAGLAEKMKHRASGLPVVADMMKAVLAIYQKPGTGRTLLEAVNQAIAEMREVNGDTLPALDEGPKEKLAGGTWKATSSAPAPPNPPVLPEFACIILYA
jgi:hypothetical protein